MQETELADLAALATSVYEAKLLTAKERKERRDSLSAEIKELKSSMLTLLQELESLYGGSEETIFEINTVKIADGVLTANIAVDLNLLMDYYQSIPGHSSNTLPLIAEGAVFEALSNEDFGSGAKPGDRVIVIDILDGEMVALGTTVSNDGNELRLSIADDATYAYSHDAFAFRYLDLFDEGLRNLGNSEIEVDSGPQAA